MLCNFIHELCIENFELIKTIIFNVKYLKFIFKYKFFFCKIVDLDLVEKVIKNIECMHIGLIIMNELFQRFFPENIEYLVLLITNLSEKYPMQNSLESSKFFLKSLETISLDCFTCKSIL